MEVFHEDVLETFIFCFIASFGIIQIMAGIRGWHGLSIYGGRVRRNLNNALGAGLVILAYAYYFSDPLHRNVRNIEGFMSLVALGLGVVAAAAATILLSAGSESLRRHFRSRKGMPVQKAGGILSTISLESGMVHLTSQWGESGDNLVVLAEAGRGSERLLRQLATARPSGKGMLSLQLEPDAFNPENSSSGSEDGKKPALDMLRELEGERQLAGEVFMGLGWGADLLMQIRPELEGEFEPKHLLAVAPVVPDYDRGFVGDALLSNPPQDIGEAIYIQRPWREKRCVQLLRLWIPVAITLILLGTLVTFIFDVRWKLLIGFLAGLILSLWLAYFLAAWRGIIARGGGREERVISLLRRPEPTGGNVSTKVIITWEESVSIVNLPDTEKQAIDSYRMEVWNEVLRGKFTLVKGTLPRLVNLIWEDGDKGLQDEEPTGAP
jgi:hypothetical protein